MMNDFNRDKNGYKHPIDPKGICDELQANASLLKTNSGKRDSAGQIFG